MGVQVKRHNSFCSQMSRSEQSVRAKLEQSLSISFSEIVFKLKVSLGLKFANNIREGDK